MGALGNIMENLGERERNMTSIAEIRTRVLECMRVSESYFGECWRISKKYDRNCRGHTLKTIIKTNYSG